MDGCAEIAVRVARIEHLFDNLDPSPPPDRDLAPRVEAHLAAWAEELPAGAHPAIRIELPASELARPEAASAAEDVTRYCLGRVAAARREMRELKRSGRLALAIGLGVLALCILLGQIVPALLPFPGLAGLLGESLIILGWVALWRPLEIWLYDWWPIRRRRLLWSRLAAAPVRLVAQPGD